MSSPTVYLITGSNRGIGLDLVSVYLSLPNTTVIATVRDPNYSSTSKLSTLTKDQSSPLIIVKIDNLHSTDSASAIQILQSEQKINYLDVVVANAGIAKPQAYGPAADLKVADLKEHFDINTIGSLLLFQATAPLLKKSANSPGKFVAVSSPIGSIGGMEQRPYPMTACGVSKTALNYLVRKLHFENEEIVTFAVDPGFVQTDLGNDDARYFGMKEASITLRDSVESVIKVVDGATREKTSGHFPIWEGGEFA